MPKISSMSFNVKTISVFERQAKRLIKKFPSLKKEIQTLISELKEDPKEALPLAIAAIKCALPLPVRAKVSLAVQGLSPILFLRMVPFTF